MPASSRATELDPQLLDCAAACNIERPTRAAQLVHVTQAWLLDP